jgi:hypothetical protein
MHNWEIMSSGINTNRFPDHMTFMSNHFACVGKL